MDKRKKALLLENLSAAALLGLLGLLVAAASMVLDSASERRERAEIQAFSSTKIVGDALRGSGPGSSGIYVVSRHGKRLYAAIVSIGDHRGLVRAAVFVSPDGRIDSVEALQIVPADAPFAREGWFADFLGKGGNSPFPEFRLDSRKPELVSGATETYLGTSKTLERLSRDIQARAGHGPTEVQ